MSAIACPECGVAEHDSFCPRPYREKMQALATELADLGACHEPETASYGKVIVPLSDTRPNRLELAVAWRTDIPGERPYVRITSYSLVAPLGRPEEIHRLTTGYLPYNLVADTARDLAGQWSER